MALEEYKRKRDFKKTPEPPPERAASRKNKLSYLIQKHDATRLHYDLRLELDGVLLSWAVTRGPSLNPADKRLAVRTEDHPLSYGTFEGTIPKGEYGGGTVMLWDEGTWEPEGDPHAGLKKGHLAFVLHGERLKGGWDLIRMNTAEKRENWLLVKGNDGEADIKGKAEDFLEGLSMSVKTARSMDEIASGEEKAPKKKEPERSSSKLTDLMQRYPDVQLATLVEKPPDDGRWVHEIKFDGYRLLGFLSDGAVRLRTRNGKIWTDRFPSIAAALTKLKAKDAVLDMEAVVVNDQGVSSFQALQAVLSDSRSGGQEIVAYVFDLLHWNGNDLTELALTDRKQKLEALLRTSKQRATLRYSEHISGDGEAMLANSCGMGLEGIVSKLAAAPYVAGRQKSWLKSKCEQRQEFIILGYSGARTGGRALGALYLGYRQEGKLRYAGKVGTGFSIEAASDLVKRFKELVVQEPVLAKAEMGGVGAGEWKSVAWVKPVTLCEVAFTEWTEDGHIRHPSFQGIREDKGDLDVKKEKAVPLKTATAPQAVTKKSDALVLAGIAVTHPDRVISEEGHVTKGELAEYYSAVAPFVLRGIARHPLSLLRCPTGVNSDCFFQRNPGKGLGPDVHPFQFKHKGKTYEYLYIDDEKGLLEVIQMGAIELHPWGAPIDAIDYPDRLIFDLDPAPEVPFEALKLAAQDLRERLKRRGLESVLKCTGGKGLHVTVPLAGRNKWPEVKAFGSAVADELVQAAPEAYIATMSKAKRTGKIFIDHFRNDYTATAIADYAVRARPGAPVAVPLEWKELKSLKAANQFTMKSVLNRLKNKTPDSVSKLKGQTLPRK